MENRDFSLNELAMAYELHQEGFTWKYIAIGLGCDWVKLKDAVRNVVLKGYSFERRGIPLLIVWSANVLHNEGFGWCSISTHLGFDKEKLRLAVNKENMKNKLQIKSLTGHWVWVADLKVTGCCKGPMTTSCKAKAVPEKTYWFTDSLAQARRLFPEREFRLAASRDE